MLGKCFFVISALSIASAVYTGQLPALSEAVLDGAARGVELSVGMLGMMCLWCGFMEVLTDSGAIDRLAGLLRPVLKRIFSEAFEDGVGQSEIVASVAANLLGVANAATPFALSAMEKLDRSNPDPKTASDDMVTLAVLGTCTVNFMPTTIITLRSMAGSVSPYAIVAPVIICSAICMTLGVLLCRLTRKSRNVRHSDLCISAAEEER